MSKKFEASFLPTSWTSSTIEQKRWGVENYTPSFKTSVNISV